MKPARFHSGAKAEFLAAIRHYEGQRPGLGGDLREEVESAVRSIRRAPEIYAVRPADGLRKCPVQRFPYAVYYLVLEDEIWIAAVAHGKRKPGYWNRRSP